MKNILFSFAFLLLTLASCKKEDDLTKGLTPEQIQFAQEFETCYKGKAFPTIPQGTMYISGEIDGKIFSFSQNQDFDLACSVTSFKAKGYKTEYAQLEKNKEWIGNSFNVFPKLSEWPKNDKHFDLMLNFASFRGDSIAYDNYFTQFKKDFIFKIRTSKEEVVNSFGEIEFSMMVSGCSNLKDLQSSRIVSSRQNDQAGSYCKVSDVKEYKSADGKIFRRDITIEFDIKVGGYGVVPKHIKNGKVFFSM